MGRGGVLVILPEKLREQVNHHVSWIFDNKNVHIIAENTQGGLREEDTSVRILSFHETLVNTSDVRSDTNVGFLRVATFFANSRPVEVTDILLSMRDCFQLRDTLEAGPLGWGDARPESYKTYDDLRRWGEDLHYAWVENDGRSFGDFLVEFGNAFGLYYPPEVGEKSSSETEKKSQGNSHSVSSDPPEGEHEFFREGVAEKDFCSTYRIFSDESGEIWQEETVRRKIERIYKEDFKENRGE